MICVSYIPRSGRWLLWTTISNFYACDQMDQRVGSFTWEYYRIQLKWLRYMVTRWATITSSSLGPFSSSGYQSFLNHTSSEHQNLQMEKYFSFYGKKNGWNCGICTIYFTEALSTEFQKRCHVYFCYILSLWSQHCWSIQPLFIPRVYIIPMICQVLLDVALVSHREDKISVHCQICSLEIEHISCFTFIPPSHIFL